MNAGFLPSTQQIGRKKRCCFWIIYIYIYVYILIYVICVFKWPPNFFRKSITPNILKLDNFVPLQSFRFPLFLLFLKEKSTVRMTSEKNSSTFGVPGKEETTCCGFGSVTVGCLVKILVNVSPGRLTWNLKICHPKRKVVFQPSFFRGYVKLQEGRWNM